MKKFLFSAVIILLMISCDPEPKPFWEKNYNDVTDPYTLNQEHDFWARNIDNGSFYQLTATLLAKGKYCNVWVENGKGVTAATAQAVANAYDKNIYPKLMNAFGWVLQDGIHTMRLADMWGDNDGKLCILLLDIIDGYDPPDNTGYVGGYFAPLNFYDNETIAEAIAAGHYPADAKSNERDMIYIDIYPGEPGTEDSNRVVAHEMQHLMNFVTDILFAGNNIRNEFMDIWINEGLSSAAEWVYSGNHSNGRMEWYNADPYETISKGNNFFVWDKDRDISVLDDYSTVYLFFQWLRLQSKTDIYYDIMTSQYYDYRAVTNAARYHINSSYNDWEILLRTWLAANYINNATGVLGYRNDSVLKNVKAPLIKSTGPEVPLLPGEGVYSFVSGSPSALPSNSGNIRYLGLSNTATSTSIATNARLTYNRNANLEAAAENGLITGATPPASIQQLSVLPMLSAKPRAMSIGEYIGQKGKETGNTGDFYGNVLLSNKLDNPVNNKPSRSIGFAGSAGSAGKTGTIILSRYVHSEWAAYE